jgi:hypothetical protein
LKVLQNMIDQENFLFKGRECADRDVFDPPVRPCRRARK